MLAIPSVTLDKAKKAASKIDADVYFYNGSIESPRCLQSMETVYAHRGRPKARLFLVTNGGSPDAGYKITRYFQQKYDHFTVVISGRCKSAGTLIAVGANELAFTPYGELGPLDIQMTKVDKFDQLQSGLTIQDSLNTLEDRALNKFFEIVKDYIQSNNGLLSFPAAAKAASDFVTQLYAPVFSRIDPEEVGARARSMRIAADYGRRLAVKGQNLKTAQTLRALSETYSSHSFVIDRQEAENLFQHVREADKNERAIVEALGRYARFEVADPTDFVFSPLSTSAIKASGVKSTGPKPGTKAGAAHGHANPRGNSPKNGGNPQRTDGTPRAETSSQRRRARSTANGRRPSAGAAQR
jgi:hypothetical protein